MRAISLFSGAGGFEIGFDRAGIQTVLQAESDPWCLSVLARHWPDVERMTDVRKVDATTLQGRCRDVERVGTGTDAERVGATRGRRIDAAGVDLIYGGFPCQDVSVAGKRAGLSGERSGLWHEFRRVLRELRPRWTVIENVPGLLSSHSGRDFATILLGLEELGYGWAYRVLDTRFFGVPQRRRRVFVVGCLGDARRAAQVLAVCESCDGHPAPRRETGQAVAYSLAASVRGTGDGHGNSAGGHPGSNMPGRHKEDDVNLVVARSLTARNERIDAESENFVVAQNGSDIQVGNELGSLTAGMARQTSGDLIAFSNRGNETAGAERLRAGSHGAIPMAGGPMGVRRLTPLECERLMGWPDEWIRWTADGREIPDSHRYRMCGNGVVATVAEWLGHRLVQADAFMERAA